MMFNKKVKLFPILLASFFYLQPSTSSAKQTKRKLSIGIVELSKGAPDVLRDPQEEITKSLKDGAVKEGYTIASYKKRYWKNFPIVVGSKIFYGDELSSGPNSTLFLQLEDGFEITLAKNSKIRITRAFRKNHNKGILSGWLQILNGKIRAKIIGEKKKRGMKFRTKTMALGVRGTDIAVSSEKGISKVVVVEGEVAVRPISQIENILFDRILDSTVKGGSNIDVTKLQNRISQIKKAKETPLFQGQKIEVQDPKVIVESDNPSKAEMSKLEQLPKFNKNKATESDLAIVNDIGKKLRDDDEDLDNMIKKRFQPFDTDSLK